MTIRFLTAYPPYQVGNSATLDSATETDLIAKHIATSDLTGAVAYVAPPVTGAAGWIPLNANYTLQANDHNKSFQALGAITITVPAGLSPRPTVGLMPPPSGNLSVVGTLNGSSQTLTRALAANPSGVCLAGYPSTDGYGLSGV